MKNDIKLLEKEIIQSLKDHGERPIKSLIDNIWRDDCITFEFDSIPEKDILKAIIRLEKEGLITRIGDPDDTIQLNFEMLLKEEEREVIFITAPWKLRVLGQIYLANLNCLDKNQLSSVFKELKKKEIIDKNLHERENFENHFELILKNEGFYSKIIVFPSSDFFIETSFTGEKHPELIKPPELGEEGSKKLITSILGGGFFIMYSTLKKIVSELFEYSSLRIKEYRYIRAKE